MSGYLCTPLEASTELSDGAVEHAFQALRYSARQFVHYRRPRLVSVLIQFESKILQILESGCTVESLDSKKMSTIQAAEEQAPRCRARREELCQRQFASPRVSQAGVHPNHGRILSAAWR